MNRWVATYISAVVIGAVALSALVSRDACGARDLTPTTIGLLTFFALAALIAELKPIITPGGNETTVASSVFVASVLLLGPRWTLPVIVVSMVGSHLLSRRPLIRMVFNVAQYTLAICLGGLVYYHLLDPSCADSTVEWNSLDALAVLTFLLMYFVLNTGLVAVVVALDEGRSILRTWHLSTSELLPQYSAMVVVGVIAVMLWSITPVSILLVGFVVMIIYVSYSLAESLKIAQQDLLVRMRQLERRTAELTLLNEVGAALTRLIDLDSLWSLIANRLRQLLDFGDLFIATLDPAQSKFDVAFEQVARPLQPAEREEIIALWHRGVESGQPLILGLTAESPEGANEPQLVTIVVPILVEGRAIGVLCCRSARLHAYSKEDERFLAAVADQVAVAIENTRLRRQAAELEAIEQLNQLKTEFVSAVSHELRSPLTPIVGYAELLSLRTFSPEMTQQMASEIHRETLHLQRLVDDLLDISRIEAGSLRLDVQHVHLEDVVRQVVREYATSSQHRFEVRVPHDLPAVVGDPTRIRQIFTNLIGNAVKYSPKGGRITVVASERSGEIEVSVTDEGVGIPADKLERIFEKFYRIEGEVTRRIRGTGLGLAICKHIVDAHGGRIWAQSAGAGRGSAFSFTLPITAPASEPGDFPSGAMLPHPITHGDPA